jgi:hypothetical protein
MVRISGTLIVLFCLLLQAAVTWVWQLHFPNLLGTDAYYLVVQAQTVLTTGSLKIPDGDPIPFLMAGIMQLGVTGEAAFQITIAVIHGLMIGLLVSFLLKQAWGLGAFVGCLALVVGESIGLYHVFEFPKLSLALVILFAAIAFYRGTASRKTLSIGLFAGASLIHPAVWPVAVLSLGFLVYSDGLLSKYRSAMYVICIAVIVLSASYFLLRQGNGILNRYTEASGGPGLVVFMSRSNLPRFLQSEVDLVIILLVGALCISLIRRNYAQNVVNGALLLLTMLPASANEMFGLGERMVLIVAIAALPIVMMEATGISTVGTSGALNLRSGVVALSTLCVTAFWVPDVLANALPKVDYTKLKRIVDKVETKRPDMLIAQRSLSFYYTALTSRDAFIFEPDPDWDKRKIWRVVFDVDVDEILYFAPAYCSETPSLTESIPRTDAVLMREDCWEAFRKEVSKDQLPGLWDRVWDDEENPYKMRPGFLKDRYSR